MCEYCKYDIESDGFSACVLCGGVEGWRYGVCSSHRVAYSRAWCLGEKRAALEAVIHAYKFNRSKEAYRVMAELLDQTLPVLPADCIVTPVATVSAHIRQRGYDHTALLAQEFAKRRGLTYRAVLSRRTSARQQGASRKLRIEQAKQAFNSQACVPKTYLLVDDVLTTGATAQYAARKLREAGATDVWLVVLARQPLEK